MKKTMNSIQRKNILKSMENLRIEFEFFIERSIEEGDNDIEGVREWIDENIVRIYHGYLAYEILLRRDGILSPRIDGATSNGSESENYLTKEQIETLINLKPDKVS